MKIQLCLLIKVWGLTTLVFCLYSCQSKYDDLDEIFNQTKNQNKIVKYSTKANPSTSEIIDNYLFAKSIKKDSFLRYIELLSELQDQIPDAQKWSNFYQHITQLKNKDLILSRTYSLSELDDFLDSLGVYPYNLVSRINLLKAKSRQLGYAYSEYEYALATAFYGEYLRTKLPQRFQKTPYYLPWSIIGTLYDREQEDELAKFYYKRSLESSDRVTAGARFVGYCLETIGKKIGQDQYKYLCKKFIDSTNLETHTNQTIINDMLSKLDPEKSKEVALDKISKSTVCNEFWETTYLIDAFISLGQLEETKIYLDKLKLCNPKGIKLFLMEYRYLEYLAALQAKSNDITLNYQIANKAKELVTIYGDYGDNIINTHFADVIYRCNSYAIEALYRLVNNSEIIDKDILLSELNSFKMLYNRISDNKSLLAGRVVDKEDFLKYSDLRIQLEALELKTNKYQDTLLSDLSIYEPIYNLHKSLYDIKSNLDYDTLYKFSGGKELKYQNISPQTQIIDILQTNDYYYFTSITASDVKMKKLAKDSVNSSIAKHLQIIKDKTQINESSSLDLIIQNLVDTSKFHFVFVPDGHFFDIPLEVCLYSFLEEDKVKSVSYLSSIGSHFDQQQVSLSNSISVFSYTSESTSESREKIIIPELVGGLMEAEEISELYEVKHKYFGQSFSKKNLDIYDDKIYHFSTHSKSSKENQLGNYIVIRKEDGTASKFYGFEMKNYRFDNKLIILSSCESGLGMSKPGTGVFSLSRDFLQAGAQTVIKSLWAVNEASTKDLMVLFHTYFTEGQSAGKALSNAKRTLKQNPKYTHPYYWAGFVLEGNPNIRLQLD